MRKIEASHAASDEGSPAFLHRIAAGFGLVALMLILLPVVAMLMKVCMPGPLLFRQTRIGYLGRPFTLYKLRSMVVDAERDGPRWAGRDDSRVTRLGRWLRRTRVDELPQLWNVVAGEMNLVGPRPERPEFVALLEARIPGYARRHLVFPGITGLAQVRLPYASSVEDTARKLHYDLLYVESRSWSLDLLIAVRTALVMARMDGI